jgi:hypothetical protein
MSLFEEYDNASGATIVGEHRYRLWRVWDATKPRVLFVMLNPSRADGQQDDPTIRRCVGFARDLGYGSFSYRATTPKELFAWFHMGNSIVTPANDLHIKDAVQRAQFVVAAWGTHGGYLDRDKVVFALLREPHALGLTEAGFPRHPLYLPKDAQPFPYSISNPLGSFVQWANEQMAGE